MKLRSIVTVSLIFFGASMGIILIIGLWIAPGTVGNRPVAIAPVSHETAVCGQPSGICSPSEVAVHNLPQDCWATYNGGYYIVTSFVPQALLPATVCGGDMTLALNEQLLSVMTSYYVGPVQ